MIGRPRRHPAVRLDHENNALVTRHVLAMHTRRHPNVVLKNCTPVACDLASKALLYDFDAALLDLDSVATRRRRNHTRLTSVSA